MELTEMPLSQLSENVSNPRTITDAKLERLVESILVFPRMLSLRPIVVDENNVILGGNMRFRALSRISSMKFPTLKKTCWRVPRSRREWRLILRNTKL
nr:MAG TPA: ParB protein [Caudoviricetes sp.]